MSSAWSAFVIIGTIGSLIVFLVLLYANRRTTGGETTGHVFDGIEEYNNPMPLWWVWMFVISIVFGIGYLIYYPGLGNFAGIGGWSSVGQFEDEDEAHSARFAPFYAELAALGEAALHTNRQAQQVGRRLYVNHCSTCHGVAAQGAFGFPDLTDGEWSWGGGLANVQRAIRDGRQAAMPPWGAALGDAGVLDVSHHVLALAGRDHDAAAAERGAASFRTLCVACHGETGTGNPVLGAPDLTNDIWLYGGALEQIAFTVRHGRNGMMPAHRDILSDDQIRILAAYVTSLSAGRDIRAGR
jgi:cytochrome c oxidase cbb3-type subunit III